jgi:hypothetical protein
VRHGLRRTRRARTVYRNILGCRAGGVILDLVNVAHFARLCDRERCDQRQALGDFLASVGGEAALRTKRA